MFVIVTPKGYYKDFNLGKCEFSENLDEAKKYSRDFWAWRTIKINWLRSARVVEINAERI